jgi:hypothetical protein
MDVCNDNFIPLNWVLTETDWDNTRCPVMFAAKNVARLRAVAPSDTTLDICAGSPIPPGWRFVRQYEGISGCGGLFATSHLRWIIERNPPKKVRVVYLVPADKQIRKEYQVAIGNAILHLQNFYQSQMDTSLLVPRNLSYSINSPVVEVYRTSHSSSFYSSSTTNPNDFWNKALADGFAVSGGRFNDPNNRWIYYIDADPGCVNGSPQAVGATSGVALLPANDLRGLARKQTIGLCGQTADTLGPCRWIGGLGHELGHAFGLPHPPGCDQGNCSGGTAASNSLMFLGYLVYPNTNLLPDNVTQLFGTGFFTALGLDGPRFDCNANPIDDQRVFVRMHYIDFLQREPDPSGWDFHTNFINACGADAVCIAERRMITVRGFMESPEFRNTHTILRDNPVGSQAYNEEFIRQLYRCALQREPDPDGFNYHMTFINTYPGSYTILIGHFIESPEYRSRFQ